MPQIKHSWVWVVPIWASAQMGTTQTQLCFIYGIWARFEIIYFFSNTPHKANFLLKLDFVLSILL